MKFHSQSDLRQTSSTDLIKELQSLTEYASKLKSELKAGYSKDQKNYKMAKKQISVINTILTEKNL